MLLFLLSVFCSDKLKFVRVDLNNDSLESVCGFDIGPIRESVPVRRNLVTTSG